MSRPMMSCLLPAAEGHLHRRQGKVPTLVADDCLWRHQRRRRGSWWKHNWSGTSPVVGYLSPQGL